jgi:serine/threonine protein kinase
MENEHVIAFVSERICGSLTDLLNQSQIQNNSNSNSSNSNTGIHQFSEVELKLAIRGLCDAVSYLHNEKQVIHGFVHPNNVYFTPTRISHTFFSELELGTWLAKQKCTAFSCAFLFL